MVRFIQKLDKNSKIYIPKPLRESGFRGALETIPDFKAAVIFPLGTDLKEVLRSIRILEKDLRQRIE